jgi:hypothetical protein
MRGMKVGLTFGRFTMAQRSTAARRGVAAHEEGGGTRPA